MKRMKLWPLASLMSVGLVLGACSSDSDDADNSQQGGDASGEEAPEEELTADEITELIFAGETPDTADIDDIERPATGEMWEREIAAEETGKVEDGGDKIPVKVKVAEVVETPEYVLVEYSLQSSDGEEYHSSAQTHLGDVQPSSVMDGVTLVDNEDEVRYWPMTAVEEDEEVEKCACASIPNRIDSHEQWFFGFYPPLDSDADSVEIEVPGVDPIEVPVERTDE